MRACSPVANFVRVLLVVCLSTSGAALAASFDHNPSGQTATFGWSGVGPNFGHTGTDSAAMGSPTVNDLGLFFVNEFSDMHYTVNSGTPSLNSHVVWAMSTNGMNVTGEQVLGSNPPGAAPITQLIIRESGTFVSDAPTTDFAISQAVGIQFFDPFGFFPYTVNLPAPTFNLVDGTWETELIIDITTVNPLGMGVVAPNGVDTMRVDLVNDVALMPGAPGSASFTKLRAEIFIPEPGSMLLLSLGGAAALLRRKRQ